MKKIPTMFLRDADHRITEEINPECEWVLRGEGVATRKWDGTAVMWDGVRLWKRYTHSSREERPAPDDFQPAGAIDEQGKIPGWVPVGDGPEDTYHREAFFFSAQLPVGTYELCGPKINGNPERFSHHLLLRHGVEVLHDAPRTYSELRDYLRAWPYMEGIVFHHPDGQMAKIKWRDFFHHPPTAT